MDTDTEDKTFKWGDHTVNPSDVPSVSLFALAQRGFTHVLGNEVASAVAAWKKTEDGAKADETQIEAYAAEKRAAKLKQIMEGTLGVRTSSGPRVSGVDALIRRIATEFITAKLAKHNLKLPTGDKTIEVAGKPMTRDQLIEAEMRHSEAKIKAEADRRQAQAVEAQGSVDELFA